jgi:hypothetical protein
LGPFPFAPLKDNKPTERKRPHPALRREWEYQSLWSDGMTDWPVNFSLFLQVGLKKRAWSFSFDIPFSSFSFLFPLFFLAQFLISAWETPAQMLRED